jgi:hypothetical protein
MKQVSALIAGWPSGIASHAQTRDWPKRANDYSPLHAKPHVSSSINPANFSFFCPLWGKKYFRFAGGKSEN